LFQVSIPIQPGNSGGPVFNEKGELIGIATSSIDSIQTQKVFGSIPQNVNFAIKSSYINSLLPNLPGIFIKQKGIVPVPVEEIAFKERVKNDIVLIESVPEFKPTVVKKDYEEEGRLREEREREIAERERQLQEREQQVQDKEMELIQRRVQPVRPPRNGPCYGGGQANPDGSCDIGPLRPRNKNKPKGKFNFNIHFGN
jgi:hypothetical protein